MKQNTNTIFIILCIIISFILITKPFKQSLSTYSPKEIDDVLINPYMGWSPNALYTSYTQPHSLVYANIYWNDIEPIKGKYNFDYIEEKYNFDHWRNKDVKIILRIIMDYPNPEGNKQIPDWLYKKINQDGTCILYLFFIPNYS